MTPLNILKERLKEIEPIMFEARNSCVEDVDELVDLYNQYVASIKLIKHHLQKPQCKTKFQPLLRDDEYIERLRADKTRLRKNLQGYRRRNKKYRKQIRELKQQIKKNDKYLRRN